MDIPTACDHSHCLCAVSSADRALKASGLAFCRLSVLCFLPSGPVLSRVSVKGSSAAASFGKEIMSHVPLGSLSSERQALSHPVLQEAPGQSGLLSRLSSWSATLVLWRKTMKVCDVA